MKTRIYTGAEVNNRKNEHGVITKIITKSTGYVEVRYDDGSVKKEMAFNLTDNEGKALKATPKEHKAAAPSLAQRIESQKNYLLRVNYPEAREANMVTENELNHMAKGSDFIESLKDAWFDAYMGEKSFSEKQAYYLAKAMIESK